MIKHTTNLNEFNELIKEGTVLVDFFASWCGPCKMIGPVLEEIDANKETTASIVKVDVDQAREIAMQYRIQVIPTLILFKNGSAVKKESGFMNKSRLLDFIEK
ncbi:MAG: thioredoxin [Erysipelotrichia bacterium]|jgi:thioredoxin 1|nr:thioredoxin [Erysipelotrichia bacterium]